MWYVIKEDELCHHGIKGQKWGVRRFQNYDGSYTQAGLKRYYKAVSEYNDTVRKREFGQATRSEVKQAKSKMKRSYKQLSLDKRADKGKETYAKGRTITGNQKKAAIAGAAYLAINAAASQALINGQASKAVKDLSASLIGTGTTAVTAAMLGKSIVENRRLRAYYARGKR